MSVAGKLTSDGASTVASAVASQAYTAAMVTSRIAIDGMTCVSCSNAIESLLHKTPGVSKASVSLLRKVAEVRHNPSMINPDAVCQASAAPLTPYPLPLPFQDVHFKTRISLVHHYMPHYSLYYMVPN